MGGNCRCGMRASLASVGGVSATLSPSGRSSDFPWYDGPYEATPSRTAQTLPTNGYRMAGDVLIAAIPSNYGLITYDGSVITVS